MAFVVSSDICGFHVSPGCQTKVFLEEHFAMLRPIELHSGTPMSEHLQITKYQLGRYQLVNQIHNLPSYSSHIYNETASYPAMEEMLHQLKGG